MQSIDDEIPDLSGPTSLGMYKFTRRGQGKKYETSRLSELRNGREEELEGENKVTTTAPTSSAHSPFNPSPPTILPSSQLSKPSNKQTKAELKDSILHCLDNSSPDRRAFQEPGPRQYRGVDSTNSAANFPRLIRSVYSNRRNHQAFGQAQSSFPPPALDHRSGRDFIKPATPSPDNSRQIFFLSPPKDHLSNQCFTATINPGRQSPQPRFRQADNSSCLEKYSLIQNPSALIDSDRRSLQASRQIHPPLHTPNRHLKTSQEYSQFAKSFAALIESQGRSLKASAQASSLLTPQNIQPLSSRSYRAVESKADEWLEAQRQSSKLNSQKHCAATPREYDSPQSLPLSDSLPTASFNLETDQWDPDLPEADMLPEANMLAQTPTNKSARRGASGQQSSEKSSIGSGTGQDTRNPYAIVTTTKSGRPYTNPYMPIYPPPSTARQSVRESPSGQVHQSFQSEDAELIQRQRKTQYIDQEEARYRAAEQAKYEHAKGSLDDPFQDHQNPHTQQLGLSQPSTYAEYVANQAAHDQLPGYRHQSTPMAHAPDPKTISFFSDKDAPDTGRSPYRSQRSAYEQQSAISTRFQHPGEALLEQHSSKLRASVRLPAVRGTTEQQRHLLQERDLGNLSLADPTSKNAQDPRRLQTQGGTQLASGRVSHAVPIRDPAAYTGSGLTSRRNQEALRQNLDTVVASSQALTGTARTVMNDPHRDRQLSGRPSPTATDTTVTGSTLRAQAPSYESVIMQRPGTIHSSARPHTVQYEEKSALGGRGSLPLQAHVISEGYRSPGIPPGLKYDAATYTKNAGLPVQAVGAGNAFMNALVTQTPPERNSQQRLEDSKRWFRHDSRDLSYAAAVLPYETMNIMNAERFPLEDKAPRTVVELTDNSQDDDPSDRARQAATPRPIGHGRPAGFCTPPSVHGPRRGTNQAPFPTLTGVAPANDREAIERSRRQFREDDSKAMEAMFGGVYGNLMDGKHGPYDYMNHYCAPPTYSIDHNTRNDDTFFDPQWFATAPPARVGRDPRREQGEYEDPSQGSTVRRGDHSRAEATRRDSGGRGGGVGVRAWGRN